MSVGLLLFSAALGQLAGILVTRRHAGVWLALTVASCVAALAAAVELLTGAAWDWEAPFAFAGATAHFRADGLAGFFLALSTLIAGAGAIYAHAYWNAPRHPRSAVQGRRWWNVLAFSLGLVLVATNGLHFLLGWELFTLAAYFLVTLDRQQTDVRAAGWLYLAASHASMVALFAFFAALAAHTGSWTLGPLPARHDLAPLFWLALFGFGLKAGAFPLHIWLPSAHANAPSHVSAILSGVTIKMGVFGLLRFSGWLPLPAGAAWTVAAAGVVSAVLGVVFALGQHDLKRLLAYHSVENIGIILIGVGFALVAAERGDPRAAAWGALALAGGLLHVWNHGLFKSLLFLGAGSVLHATGTREMSRLGGLWRAMPRTTALFALGAAAISGLPPLNGFVSEWLVYLGLFGGAMSPAAIAWTAVPAIILLGMTGAIALACFTKVCGIVFLGAPRSAAALRAHESPRAMLAPMVVLASACVSIGLAPIVFWPVLARVAACWRPVWADQPAPLSLGLLGQANVALVFVAAAAVFLLSRHVHSQAQRRAPTWDCGYAAPGARMQYTAGSFAGIVTGWFAWILRPIVHELRPAEAFPAHAAHVAHTPETVLELVIAPVGRVVAHAAQAARRLQHGRLQAYLLYVLGGVGALTAIVLLGDSQ